MFRTVWCKTTSAFWRGCRSHLEGPGKSQVEKIGNPMVTAIAVFRRSLRTLNFTRLFLDTDELEMILRAWKVSGASKNGPQLSSPSWSEPYHTSDVTKWHLLQVFRLSKSWGYQGTSLDVNKCKHHEFFAVNRRAGVFKVCYFCGKMHYRTLGLMNNIY